MKAKWKVFRLSPTEGEISEFLTWQVWYKEGYGDQAIEASKLISKSPEMYEALKEMYFAFIWKEGNEKAKKKAFQSLVSLLKEIENES